MKEAKVTVQSSSFSLPVDSNLKVELKNSTVKGGFKIEA